VSLPARQQRVLDGIATAVAASEPQLASMFAIFTKLTSPDGPARTERLPRSRHRLPHGLIPLVLVHVMFALRITGALRIM
jgi:hypothetical protein